MINLKEEFKQEMKDILKDEYDSFIESYNLPSFKGLRLNQLKIQDATLLPFCLEPIPWCPTGYYYKDSDQPGKHIFHEMGLYYIQEPSAMAVVEELDVKEVIDYCFHELNALDLKISEITIEDVVKNLLEEAYDNAKEV